jgi:hypothetical protein
MGRRLNRGISPHMLSHQDQELLVRSADNDPLMRKAIEVFIGRKWDSLNFGQKLIAVAEELEKARSSAVLVQALRARSDLSEVVNKLVGESQETDETGTVAQAPANPPANGEPALAGLAAEAATLPPRQW